MDQQLCGTLLTGTQLLQFLTSSPAAHITGHKLANLEATAIGDGQGFTSKVLRVNLTWTIVDSKAQIDYLSPPKSVIVKVIGNKAVAGMFDTMSPEEICKLNEQIKQIHEVECTIYSLPGFAELMHLPICYFQKPNEDGEPGVIVLEDLGDRGAAMPPRSIGLGLNEAQTDGMIDALATAHAWSVNTSIDWKCKVLRFHELRLMAMFFEQVANLYDKSKQTYPHAFEDVDDARLASLLKYDEFLKVFSCDAPSKYGMPEVLVHGDLHFVNTMFEKCPTNVYGDRVLALIDWQMAHKGCGMEDLARLMAMCLSIEKKRKYRNGEVLVRRYVELFNSKLKNPSNTVTYENAKRAFDDFFAYHATMWGVGLAMLDPFAKQMKGLTEEGQVAVRDRIAEYNIDNFGDARKIFKF